MIKSKKTFLLILLTALQLSVMTYSQNQKYEIKLQVENSHSTLEKSILDNTLLPSINVGYQINKWLDAGVVFGYTPLFSHINYLYAENLSNHGFTSYYGEYVRYNNSELFMVGVNSNVHILPIFNITKLKFDVYFVPSVNIAAEQYIDLAYIASKPIIDFTHDVKRLWSKPQLQYGIGFGLKYSFSKNYNIFGEYNVGKYFEGENKKIRLGMGFRF